MKLTILQIFFLLLVLSVRTFAIDDNHTFRRMTIEDGLSNSNVNCFAQDSTGFIWIGTENGLNRFDGYTFTQYFSDVNKQNALLSNEILSLLVDSEGTLWLGSFQGLYRYSRQSDNFILIDLESVSIFNSVMQIYSIFEDHEGTLWLGTAGNGLIKYNKETGEASSYYADENKPNSISSNFVFFITEDKKGNFWIGTTDNGLDVFNPETGMFFNHKPIKNDNNQQNVNAVLKIFNLNDSTYLIGTRADGIFSFNIHTESFHPYTIECKDDYRSISPYEVYEIFRDSKNNLWISVHGQGLYFKRADLSYFTRIEYSATNLNGLINNNVRSILEDAQGNLWIASFQGGVNFLPNKIENFDSYQLIDQNSNYVSTTVNAIVSDENRNVWVGTDGSGLKYINKLSKQVRHYYPDNNPESSIPDKVIMSLLLDGNELWMGTYLGGLSRMNVKTRTFKNYIATGQDGAISANFVTCIYKSKKGDIWIGTNSGGLNKYNKHTDSFSHFVGRNGSGEESLTNNYINTIAEDNNGRLWLGTYWGLSVFDPLNGMFINYLRDPEVQNTLSNNIIYDILISSRNEVWIGTRDGLNKFIPRRNAFQSFNLSDGLAGNVIYGIEEDEEGNLWISTNNGLCNLSTITFQTRNYHSNDGLLSNEFFRHSSHKASDGELYFGGINGLNSFNPKNIQENYSIPVPKITQFRVFNQVIQPGDTIDGIRILKESIWLVDTVILKRRFNSFGFEFSAMDYIQSVRNSYRCKMEGFDNDWREMNYAQRFVTYTNLNAGTYTFRLKASSIENRWNDTEKQLTIIITPPVYRTWWAYSIYFILFVAGLLLIWRIVLRRVNLRNQIKLERMESMKMKEINQAKLQFFTNISHEFRTPITLILGPLSKMQNDNSLLKKYGDGVDLMIKNSKRLLRLVNQLMDLRKIETGKMRLKTEHADIILFLQDVFDTFRQLAEKQNIDFKFISYTEFKHIWFDPDKIDKIIFNLLSNAFKFTPEYGEIELIIEEEDGIDQKKWLRIAVKDSGKGILEEEQNKVFERFFQTSDRTMASSAGSGVGLSLTRSLVEQHYGEIHLKSEEGRGAEFIILLPIDEKTYSDEEKFSPEVPGVNKYIHNEPFETINEELIVKLSVNKDQSILIVEDNPDLRSYLKNELVDFYNVYEAANGKEGFDMALNKVPDLIISDVLMPEMDGLEMCRLVKMHFLTNHIPVILLTARASMEHRIKGIEYGADSYIPKPFNLQHLRIRIKKLLELRSVLKSKYANNIDSDGSISVMEENQYLKVLNEYILDKIDDLSLNIEGICKDLGISRAHFYRKIKLMTGKSPSEYIRMIRLNEAAKILSTENYSISEVGYKVGFNSPSYFSISFKKQFKLNPVEFAKRRKGAE